MSPPPTRNGWGEWINTFLTTFVAFSTLLVAYAQWRTSERQTEIAQSLRALEYAKSGAKFAVEPSKKSRNFQIGISDRSISLPKNIKILARDGVKEIAFIDVHMIVLVSKALGGSSCDLDIRGLYMDNHDHEAELWPPSADHLENMIGHLEENGLNVLDQQVRVRVTYVSLVGNMEIKQINLKGEEVVFGGNPLPVYSGAWSNGEGFFIDEGAPRENCPELAPLIERALKDAGGKSGLPL